MINRLSGRWRKLLRSSLAKKRFVTCTWMKTKILPGKSTVVLADYQGRRSGQVPVEFYREPYTSQTKMPFYI